MIVSWLKSVKNMCFQSLNLKNVGFEENINDISKSKENSEPYPCSMQFFFKSILIETEYRKHILQIRCANKESYLFVCYRCINN